jgi:hypothetical protein
MVNRGRRERSSARLYGRSIGRVGRSPTQVPGEFGDGVADGYVERAFGWLGGTVMWIPSSATQVFPESWANDSREGKSAVQWGPRLQRASPRARERNLGCAGEKSELGRNGEVGPGVVFPFFILFSFLFLFCLLSILNPKFEFESSLVFHSWVNYTD